MGRCSALIWAQPRWHGVKLQQDGCTAFAQFESRVIRDFQWVDRELTQKISEKLRERLRLCYAGDGYEIYPWSHPPKTRATGVSIKK